MLFKFTTNNISIYFVVQMLLCKESYNKYLDINQVLMQIKRRKIFQILIGTVNKKDKVKQVVCVN